MSHIRRSSSTSNCYAISCIYCAICELICEKLTCNWGCCNKINKCTQHTPTPSPKKINNTIIDIDIVNKLAITNNNNSINSNTITVIPPSVIKIITGSSSLVSIAKAYKHMPPID